VIGGISIGTSGGSDLTPGRNPLVGSLLAVSGAAAFAIYMVIGRKLRAKLELLPYIWLVYSCAAIMLILVVLLTRIPVTGYSLMGYAWVVALALIPQLIGHSSFNYAVKYLPATFIGVAAQLEPVASAFIAVILFKEMPQPVQVLGSAVILAGVILALVGQSK
jgi:drug/metabolite transporter (DMT)-like permease